MGILESIKSGIEGHFEKRKEDQEFMDNLRRESEAQKRLIFEEEFRKNALEVAKAEAKREAAQKSGLQKLRATNRLRRLNEVKESPDSFFGKLSSYTHRNIANREANLKRTEELRETAKKIREDNLTEQKRLRQERMIKSNSRKPFQR